MAFGTAAAQRFLDAAKSCSGQIRSGAGSAARGAFLGRSFPDQGFQWRPIVQAAVPPDRNSMPIGVKLFDRILGTNGDRIRRDLLAPLPSYPLISVEREERKRGAMGMTVEDARKVLKASQMELVRSRLREIPKRSVPLSEFLRICCEASSVEHGPEIARSLDESEAVIVLGNVVFVKPDEVARAMERAMSPLRQGGRSEELGSLEAQKAAIEGQAEAEVRRELWCGLLFMAAQTVGLMRLTFWELSWDVMEPICFYFTSLYFFAGYVFFMRTSTDPSFEGFFNSRLAAKRKKLMAGRNFNLCRYNELKGLPGLL